MPGDSGPSASSPGSFFIYRLIALRRSVASSRLQFLHELNLQKSQHAKSVIQRLNSSPKSSSCHPERSEGSAFRANVTEKADSSGKLLPRNDNLSILRELVEFAAGGGLLRADAACNYFRLSVIFGADWRAGQATQHRQLADVR